MQTYVSKSVALAVPAPTRGGAHLPVMFATLSTLSLSELTSVVLTSPKRRPVGAGRRWHGGPRALIPCRFSKQGGGN
ncbi:hypothetical protein TRP8649_01487 [Pelagimonas phthalicica]|uniref:Uncharacterized protein n=1 Tax=Pelagimonas phthalicica TaxID=1037362 RepID=A0A238JBP0_9RHOB|nr:hypothetical protein CLV87_0585 [Pelagimonas phthalicica]SMX27382.1 hypothetical protein TRP8649_01487 [Pelagimonas phthalicica]